MARSAREEACALVYRRFPALAGTKPSVQHAGANRVYTFARSVPTSPGGPAIRQVVRVTVDAGGNIVRVVASR